MHCVEKAFEQLRGDLKGFDSYQFEAALDSLAMEVLGCPSDEYLEELGNVILGIQVKVRALQLLISDMEAQGYLMNRYKQFVDYFQGCESYLIRIQTRVFINNLIQQRNNFQLK